VQRVRLALFLFLSLRSVSARAECTPASRQSPCIDADGLWLPTAPSFFLTIPSAHASRPGTLAARLGVTLLSRPIVLTAPSPDPAGREVLVVDDVVDASIGLAYAPLPHLAVDVAAPFTVFRTGTGLSGVTTQHSRNLPATAPRDLRLGAQHDLVLSSRRQRLPFGAATRVDLTLPTGDETTFAGDRGVVTAPSLLLSVERGLFFAGGQLGARLRLPVELGHSRLGSQLVTALGLGLTPFEQPFSLDVAFEAWLMPTLGGHDRMESGGAHVESTQIASEWLVSARARSGATTFALGGGAALPLSSETRTTVDGTSTTRHFAGVATPRWRGVLTLTHALQLDGVPED